MLEDLMQSGDVEDMKEFHKDNTVHFVLKLKDDVASLERQEGGIEKKFRLVTTMSANNLVLFDKNQKIRKYANELEILEEFYGVRFDLYKKRKEHLLRVLRREIAVLENKCRFIKELTGGSLKIQGVPKQQVIKLLVE